MEIKLIELVTGKLLEKFGSGNHKPGSGSASAFQGMIAAQMLRTVIDLTNEPKRSQTYGKSRSKLLQFKKEIDETIYPQLERLFEEDSIQFDKVIQSREARDNERNPLKKRDLNLQSKNELVPATEIPLEIASLCVKIAEMSIFVFDHGFRAARGDSGVALNSAVSAIASCLFIIELNLLSVNKCERVERIKDVKKDIKDSYENLSTESLSKLAILEGEVYEKEIYTNSISIFAKGNLEDRLKTDEDIEELARNLQNTLWVEKDRIWKEEDINDPMLLLNPKTVLKKILDYIVIGENSLGIYQIDDEMFQVAGIIDKRQKTVKYCSQYPEEVQNFTLAHELGHAIMHDKLLQHRDRPLDGSINSSKSTEEMQADRFAVHFLMPRKIVQAIFFKMFAMNRFVINEDTALALRVGNHVDFKRRCNDKRGLSRVIASAVFFAGQDFNSLAKSFNVSVEAMAIRLEELELVEF